MKRGNALTSCAIAVAVAALADCGGSDCQVGQAKCQGGTLMYCQLVGDIFGQYEWVGQDCQGTCVNVPGFVGCADSAEPVSQCPADGGACWNNSTTYCDHGYPTSSTSCASRGGACVSNNGCAFCTGGTPTPDARCPTATVSSAFCAGNTAYECTCAEVVQSTVCAAPTPNCVITEWSGVVASAPVVAGCVQ